MLLVVCHTAPSKLVVATPRPHLCTPRLRNVVTLRWLRHGHGNGKAILNFEMKVLKTF
jgi:hypothetical protein